MQAVGEALVQRIQLIHERLDLVRDDRRVAARERATIPQIFARHGEPYFRDSEARVIAEVAGRRDVVIALGVLIGGDTNHHEMVGQSVSHALQGIAVQTGVPVINGVIVTDTRAQAAARCLGRINRGAEFAAAALAMAALKRGLRA